MLIRRFKYLVILLLLTLCVAVSAQSFEERYRSFEKTAKKTYADFRDEANSRYAKFLAEAWQFYYLDSAVLQPRQNWQPPVIYEESLDSVEPSQLPCAHAVAKAKDEARPKPVAPVNENHELTERVDITFYGTKVSFRKPKLNVIKLTKVNEKQIARAWETLAGEEFDNLLFDCLAARDKLQLCDFAYVQLLKSLSEEIYGQTPEAVLLKAFLYAQSGYAMRLATTQAGKLYMLMGSRYLIFNQKAFKYDDLYFYPMEEVEGGLMICNKPFSNEQPMTLLINNDQLLAADSIWTITRQSKMGIATTVTINRNTIDFYNTYPTGNVGGDIGTRLAIYANAPLEQSVKEQLYPVLEDAVKENTEREAVNKLLNYVQTAFAYELDDKVWGEDRAFFPLESFYYPYNDCEDRSVLFSRLVRDILHLDVVLLHYPGHLATAVHFNQDVKGDCVMVEDKKYIVCDPTYIGASVGKAMPYYKGVVAKVFTL